MAKKQLTLPLLLSILTHIEHIIFNTVEKTNMEGGRTMEIQEK